MIPTIVTELFGSASRKGYEEWPVTISRSARPFRKALHFALVGIQQSGTNLLREVLNTNSRIALLAEVLLAHHVCQHLGTIYNSSQSRDKVCTALL
jgi:hypothetical protein